MGPNEGYPTIDDGEKRLGCVCGVRLGRLGQAWPSELTGPHLDNDTSLHTPKARTVKMINGASCWIYSPQTAMVIRPGGLVV